jgi:hypothetical protein
MGYLEGLSKSIDVAVPLALKLHEMNRNAAAAQAKLQQDAAQFAENLKIATQKNAIDTLKATVEAGGEIPNDLWKSVTGSDLRTQQVFAPAQEAESAEALRAKLTSDPAYARLENLQITPTNPVPGRGFQAEDFEGATRFDVSGQQVVQPVSVDLQKKAQDLEQRRLEEDARDRRAIEANETRIKAAEIAQRWRLDKEPEKWSDPYQMVIGGKTVLVRKNLATNETVKISEDSPKVDNKPEDKERKVIEAQNATDELLVGRNKRVPIEKERLKWLNSVRRAAGLPPMIEKFVDNWGPLNEYTYEPAVSGVGPRAQQAGGSSPKPSNVIRYDAKGNRL